MTQNDDDKNSNKNDDNKIVSLQERREQAERDEQRREKEVRLEQKRALKPPPAINLPPVTKYFLGIIILVHLIISFALSAEWVNWVYFQLGFVPARFAGDAPFDTLTILTPITYMFIHGSWIHIGMNAIMIAAFGTGVERWLGGKKMAQIFFISGLIGIALQYMLDTSSLNPVIGASGGLSGLFAGALIMMHKTRGGVGGSSLYPMIGIVLVTYLLFGLVGSPDGNSVAWAAHVGGFLGGFAAMKLLKII